MEPFPQAGAWSIRQNPGTDDAKASTPGRFEE
jgi:hypothetical protein